MFHMGGAVARVSPGATAYPGRDVDHNIIIDAAWLPEQDDAVLAAETTWAREFLDALEPHRAGVYVNFLGRIRGMPTCSHCQRSPDQAGGPEDGLQVAGDP
jgi:hypothetical protein